MNISKNEIQPRVIGGFYKENLKDAFMDKRPIDEPVEARCAYFSDGKVETIWCVLDFMDFDVKTVQEIISAIQKETAIPTRHIHVLTTHNHSASELPYLKTNAIAFNAARASSEARANAEPLFMRFAKCNSSRRLNYRRRIAFPIAGMEAQTTVFWGPNEKNDYAANQFLEYQASVLKNDFRQIYNGSSKDSANATTMEFFPPGDPLIAVWRFEDQIGNVKGWFCRYAAHAICCNRHDHYSSDFPFYFRHTLEKAKGGTALFFNGPCGDIAPGIESKNSGHERTIGEQLGKDALRIIENADREPLNILIDVEKKLPVVARDDFQAQGPVQISGNEELQEIRKKAECNNLFEHRDFLMAKMASPKKENTARLGGLRLNNTILLALPGETFWSTGEKIISKGNNKLQVITVTEHDRTLMYIVPQDECNRGGYENCCRLTAPNFEEKLLSTGVALLHELQA